jgi:hypothetical protein
MKRPFALWFLVGVNAVAAIVLFIASPLQNSGNRGLAFAILAAAHTVLAAGLAWRRNWARVLMLIYAVFQFAGLTIGVVVAAAFVQADGWTPYHAMLFVVAAVVLPLLLWATLYLLGPAGQALFPEKLKR